DRDAVVGGPRGILSRVGEVGNADLNDSPAVETSLYEAAYRGAVADAVAEIMMGIDCDESGRAEPVSPDAESRRNGRRVVTSEYDEQARRPRCCGGGLDGSCLALGAVRLLTVAPVLCHEGANIRRPIYRAIDRPVLAVVVERGTHCRGRAPRAAGRNGRAPGRDAEQGQIDGPTGGRWPTSRARPQRIVRQRHCSPSRIGIRTCRRSATSMASSYPASACRMTPIAGSLPRTLANFSAARALPSATVTCPA